MSTFLARLFKVNQKTIFFSLYLLLFIVLIINIFSYNNKFLLKDIPDNLAWAQIDPNLDSDGDGISDILELEGDPNNDRDTDGDGKKDFRDPDTCIMPTVTGMGPINLQLWLYECDQNCELIKDPNINIIYFTGCNPIGTDEIDLPSSYGDFPYGLWRFKVNLSPEFKYYDDYEIFHKFHKIFLEIFFPGPTKPLSSEYWSQEYDIDKKRVVWEEYSQDLFFPNVDKHSITIQLSDSRPSESQPLDIEPGYGDSDPNQWIIDHEGGLLWPTEVGGRCFIDYIFSKK